MIKQKAEDFKRKIKVTTEITVPKGRIEAMVINELAKRLEFSKDQFVSASRD